MYYNTGPKNVQKKVNIVCFHPFTKDVDVELCLLWTLEPYMSWDGIKPFVNFFAIDISNLGESMVQWIKSGSCKIHTRVHNFFNLFVSPLTIPTFMLYSFLKVHNFFKNGSISLVYSLFSSCISLLEWLISMWIFFTFHLFIYFSNHSYV